MALDWNSIRRSSSCLASNFLNCS
uniref:Uncharacterized protein n=1 Tax=Arundo donax TaxID=35708 RepID=A0A0A8YBR9_ARUDO